MHSIHVLCVRSTEHKSNKRTNRAWGAPSMPVPSIAFLSISLLGRCWLQNKNKKKTGGKLDMVYARPRDPTTTDLPWEGHPSPDPRPSRRYDGWTSSRSSADRKHAPWPRS
ncbi:hypothetical protein H104_00982, partial [Trichophyton rubrum CBS 289.86]